MDKETMKNIVMTIAKDRPELITDDLDEHVSNLAIHGTSILLSRYLTTGKFSGKSPTGSANDV